jgi:hypothetical protein
MVKLTKNDGEAVSFSIRGLKEFLKNQVIGFFAWIHKKLASLEDKILKKLDDLGKYAQNKISERTEPVID